MRLLIVIRKINIINKLKFFYQKIYYRLISKNKLAKILGVKFGKNCHFMTRNWGSEPYLIEIGDHVSTSSGVKFITHDGSVRVLRQIYPELKNIDLINRICIANNVFIGIDSIILPGTIVESNVIIGACSVVKGRLKSNSVYVGIPAKRICSIEEYKEKNEEKFIETKHMNPIQKKEFLLGKKKIYENSDD